MEVGEGFSGVEWGGRVVDARQRPFVFVYQLEITNNTPPPPPPCLSVYTQHVSD